MSLSYKEKLLCPLCGEESEFTHWQSINTAQDPELKSAVRDLSAFRFSCSNCGHTSIEDYGFHYHQMEDSIMIYYEETDKDERNARYLLSGKRAGYRDPRSPIYLDRIVRSQEQLLEKLAIFDTGLDDRLVEICKVFILREYKKKHPGSNPSALLMSTDEEGRHIIKIFEKGKQVSSTVLKDDMYTKIKDFYSLQLPELREELHYNINLAWAQDLLRDE